MFHPDCYKVHAEWRAERYAEETRQKHEAAYEQFWQDAAARQNQRWH